MLLWASFALMTAVLLGVVLRPLFVSGSQSGGSATGVDDDQAVSVYQVQIEQMDSDVARGVLSAEEADVMRAEVSRRLLLQADMEAESYPAPVDPGRLSGRAVAGAVLFIVPAVTLAFYLSIGSHSLPSQPLSVRIAESTGSPGLGELMRRVEDRLAKFPEDGRGWDVVAPIYLRIGRFDDAIEAYSQAARILGPTPKRLLGLGEATVFRDDGIVSERARRTFERVLTLEPKAKNAAFWLVVSVEQDGRLDEARAAYLALLDGENGENDETGIIAAVRRRVASIDQRLRKPEEGGRGPSQDDIAAASKLTSTERNTFIESMVAGLAERLQDNGKDIEGWLKLVRSYAVLGRKAEATQALKRARDVFKGNSSRLQQLRQLAMQLKLET